eukprot:4474458-Pyramimonas_sp.AAC.1
MGRGAAAKQSCGSELDCTLKQALRTYLREWLATCIGTISHRRRSRPCREEPSRGKHLFKLHRSVQADLN